ncbi:MAG: 50S ribosomal protein L21 [Clostridia bacterium]
MYAIIVTGGKQYKVEKDLVLKVELLKAEVGSTVKFDILMLNDAGKVTTGNPIIAKAYAEAEVIENGRGRKLDMFTYKPKKNVRKRKGHRQPFTKVKIINIVG